MSAAGSTGHRRGTGAACRASAPPGPARAPPTIRPRRGSAGQPSLDHHGPQASLRAMPTTWIASTGSDEGGYTDIRYEQSAAPDEGIAKITIARPEVRNAFRPRTIIEISDALED